MRRKVLLSISAAALAVLILAVLAIAGVLPGTGPRLTILMYHHIVADGEPINGMTITASRFEEDMCWLSEHGYTTVLPRELASGEPLPEKPVLITFDDGYASNYNYAFPVLQRLDMKAAIAVVGVLVDSDCESFLTWDMCREMTQSGLIEIGSHSYNLHNLDERAGLYVEGTGNGIQRREGESREEFDARVLADLQRSIDEIEEQLDTPVTYLAYPFGVTEPWADEYITEHFFLTVTTQEGAANLSGGLYDLPRRTVSMERPMDKCFRPIQGLVDLAHSILG